MSSEQLKGKVAVITGGGAGLGAAMDGVLAAAGMNVALLDIAGDGAKEHGVATTWQCVDVVDLLANDPYLVPHGAVREGFGQRRDAMEAAFRRVEAS